MDLEIKNKENKPGPEKSFLGYVREIRNNLKNFVSEIFSTNKENKQELNNLKQDVKVDKSNKIVDKDNKIIDKNKGLFQNLKAICVRSKKYGDVNKDDCGFVSIGLLQFHGDKTGKILKNIKSVDPDRFNSIMTDPLFKDIDKAGKSKRNDTQASQYKKLMEDPKAQREMDKAVNETIEGYLEKVRSWGVTDEKAILTFGRLCNYGSAYAKKIHKKMIENGANTNDYKQIIEWFEKTEESQGKTITSQKFKKKYSYFGNKSIEEVLDEYDA